ncbi:annexin A2 [Astyanax mexicanus]|uniref:annexin A2 n=1 Tax=Astyanax mexicanus TaxID=7994 RepID=UPI0020CB1E9F|nr:annexin A2 [Astyanax mexicanus]
MKLNPSEELCWGTLGTVRPFPDFHPERDVAVIQAALDKKDINTLVRILTNRSNAQRQVLAQIYQNLTKKDLKAGLKKVLSGDLEALMLGLMMTPYQFEAHRLRQAMEGVGTDEETLLEILCTRTPQQLSSINAVYNKEYKCDLEKDLISETSGDFTKLLVALLKKEPGRGPVEPDTEALSEELSNKKVDAGPWIRILTTRDPAHLRNVLIQLEAETGQPVSDVIEKRFGGIFSGDFKLGLKTLVRCIQNPHLYLAQRIKNMKASVLQGVMLSHSEEDLLAVRVAYKAQTGTSLYTTLQKQFKGDLQQALLAVCRAED